MSEKKKIYKTDSTSKESSETSFEFEKLNIPKADETSPEPKQRGWNLFLLLCCLTVCFSSSFQFGYNISVLNAPTKILKLFIKDEMFCFQNDKKISMALIDFNTNNSSLNDKEYANATIIKNESLRIDKNINHLVDVVWTIINCLFVIGGMIGSLSSKYILDFLGRKRSILYMHIFTMIASILVIISPYVRSPVCILISRFLFGLQGGLASSLIPIYLSEISPNELRGRTGLIHSLFLTAGILIGEILGFTQILGNEYSWNFLLGFPIIPSLIGGISFLFFFPESPKALLLTESKYDEARKAMILLRGDNDVDDEMEQIMHEINQSNDHGYISIIGLFKSKELRWPLYTSLGLHAIQQLSGINGITFYSSSIFLHANIDIDHIQYAIAATGAVNMVSTGLSVPFIDRFGRLPLLVFPLLIIIFDLILLTIFLNLNAQIFSYLSIVCILIFVMCFSVGIGPIPFIYNAECFRQNSRSSAMALGAFVNWTSAFIITLIYPFLHMLLKEMIFLVFLVLCTLSVLFILLLVPETKGKSIEDIKWQFRGKRKPRSI